MSQTGGELLNICMKMTPLTLTIQTVEDIVPPGKRKPVPTDVTFEHTLDLASYTAEEAPVVMFETHKDGTRATEYRGVDMRCYMKAHGGHKPRTEYSRSMSRFHAVREIAEDWARYVLIDGETWRQVSEPCYRVEPQGWSRLNSSICVALSGEGGPDVTMFNAFNAHELELAKEVALKGTSGEVDVRQTLEILDPSYVRIPSYRDRVHQARQEARERLEEIQEALEAFEDREGLQLVAQLLKKASETTEEAFHLLPTLTDY